MAGALDAPGNIGPGHEGAEYNLWADPVAADAVLHSDVPVTLVPLDATNDVPITVHFALALQRRHYATSAASVAWELMDVTRTYAGGTTSGIHWPRPRWDGRTWPRFAASGCV